MLQMINEGNALNIHERYFTILEKTGYIKPNSMVRFLAYQFILDLVEYGHAFFTEEDYDKVNAALEFLFSNGGCLLPYQVFCTNRVTVGRNEYLREMKIRKTEDASDYLDRYTEDDYHRTV